VDAQELSSLLARAVGAVHTSYADSDRAAYGELAADVVIWPGAAEEIVEVIRAVRGGGAQLAITGEGSQARHRWPKKDGRFRVALDTQRLTNIMRLDETSLLVQSQCGIQLRFLEDALRREGLTLGPLPDSMYASTLGGVLADPPAVAYSPLAGALIDACIGVTVATPQGNLLETRISPRSATGPDISRLYLASGGALGVITDAVLRVRRRSEQESAQVFRFPNAEAALEQAREVLALSMRPARMRVLGNAAAARAALSSQAFAVDASLALTFSGPPELVSAQRARVEASAKQRGGSELPQQIADRWARDHTDPVPREQPRAHAFVPHSAACTVLKRLRERLPAEHAIVCDQIVARGTTLWLGATAETAASAAPTDPHALLREVDLEPRRTQQPSPVADRLREKLDPQRILLSPRWHRD